MVQELLQYLVLVCTLRLGAKIENIIMCDSKGVIRQDRDNLTSQKQEFATTRRH